VVPAQSVLPALAKFSRSNEQRRTFSAKFRVFDNHNTRRDFQLDVFIILQLWLVVPPWKLIHVNELCPLFHLFFFDKFQVDINFFLYGSFGFVAQKRLGAAQGIEEHTLKRVSFFDVNIF
jgi:hypothetical protein